MANVKPKEKRLNKIDSSLRTNYEYDVKKIEAYLTALLIKCLEALAEKDLDKYNLAESVLNEAIVKYGTYIKNFHEVYKEIKYNATVNFLKGLLKVEDITVLNNVNPVEALVISSEDLKEIKNVWDYIHFSVAKKEIYEYWKNERNYKTFENEAYTVLFNLFYIVIIDKNNVNGTFLDTNYNFKLGLDSEIDVLEGFVTKQPELITPLTIAERIVLAENELDVTADNNYNYIVHSLEEDELIYYNENEDFLVLINDSSYYILNKKTGKSINFYLQHFQKDIFKTIKFLAVFSDYCLGVEGTLKEKMIDKKEPEEVLFQGMKNKEVAKAYDKYYLDSANENLIENNVKEIEGAVENED